MHFSYKSFEVLNVIEAKRSFHINCKCSSVSDVTELFMVMYDSAFLLIPQLSGINCAVHLSQLLTLHTSAQYTSVCGMVCTSVC